MFFNDAIENLKWYKAMKEKLRALEKIKLR
jgi:hypothetical protein